MGVRFGSTLLLKPTGTLGDASMFGPGDGTAAPNFPSSDTGICVHRGIVNILGGSYFSNQSDIAGGGRITASGVAHFAVANFWRVNGSSQDGILFDGCSGPVFLNNVDVSSSTGNGITFKHCMVFASSGITGSSNGGVGLRLQYGANVTITDLGATTTITGTGGAAQVGSNTAEANYTNLSGTPASSHSTDYNASSSGVATSQGCRLGP
jgi:hypothetical protein